MTKPDYAIYVNNTQISLRINAVPSASVNHSLLLLASMAEQTGLSLTCQHTSKDRFSHGIAPVKRSEDSSGTDKEGIW